MVWQDGGGAVYGYAAVVISSSSFTSCYTSGQVSARLGVIVHGASRVGGHAFMYILVVVFAVVVQPT